MTIRPKTLVGIDIVHPLKKEFLQLFQASGWTQAEAARRLEMTRGGLNGIVTGETVPSVATVKLFRLMLQGERPGMNLPVPTAQIVPNEGATPKEERALPLKDQFNWQTDVLRELTELAEEDRRNVLDGLKAFLKSVPKKGQSKRAA